MLQTLQSNYTKDFINKKCQALGLKVHTYIPQDQDFDEEQPIYFPGFKRENVLYHDYYTDDRNELILASNMHIFEHEQLFHPIITTVEKVFLKKEDEDHEFDLNVQGFNKFQKETYDYSLKPGMYDEDLIVKYMKEVCPTNDDDNYSLKDFGVLTKFLFDKEPDEEFEEKFFRHLMKDEDLEEDKKDEWEVDSYKVESFIGDKLRKIREPEEHQIKTIRIYDRSNNYSLIKSILVEDIPKELSQEEANLPSVLHFKNYVYYFKRIQKKRKPYVKDGNEGDYGSEKSKEEDDEEKEKEDEEKEDEEKNEEEADGDEEDEKKEDKKKHSYL